MQHVNQAALRERLFYDFLETPPQNDDELHFWMVEYLKLDIPRRAVCPEHVAPFSFVADQFFERAETAFGFASRGSGKTLGVAALNAADAVFKENTDTVCAGAVQQQADEGYRYLTEFFQREPLLAALLDGGNKKGFELANGSRVKLTTATYCLVGDTPVWTDEGMVSIRDVEVGQRVWGWRDDHLELGVVAWSGQSGREETLDVTLSDGTVVGCTADHQFRTWDSRWVRAGDLRLGDELLGVRQGAADVEPVPSMVQVAGVDRGPVLDVYDLTVPGCNSFIAGTVVVKNSGLNGPHPCAQWDTNVATARGIVPIIEVRPGDRVWAWTRGEVALCEVTHAGITGFKPVVVLELSNGRELRLTHEHRVLRADGTRAKASTIVPGDLLLGAPMPSLPRQAALGSPVDDRALPQMLDGTEEVCGRSRSPLRRLRRSYSVDLYYLSSLLRPQASVEGAALQGVCGTGTYSQHGPVQALPQAMVERRGWRDSWRKEGASPGSTPYASEGSRLETRGQDGRAADGVRDRVPTTASRGTLGSRLRSALVEARDRSQRWVLAQLTGQPGSGCKEAGGPGEAGLQRLGRADRLDPLVVQVTGVRRGSHTIVCDLTVPSAGTFLGEGVLVENCRVRL